MGTELIIIIIAIVLLFVYLIIEGIRTFKKRTPLNPIPLILMIIGILFAILVHNRGQELIARDWAQILLMIGLVTVTAVYAFSTQKQADASVKMVKATRDQLLSEARPYLLLSLYLGEGQLLQWDDYESKRRPTTFTVRIYNAGKGPAINLEAALWHREKTYFARDRKGYLAPDQEWQATISRLDTRIPKKEGWLPQLSQVIKENHAGIIAVEYQDVHKRKWASYLCLERHVDIEQCVVEGEQNIVEIKNHD